MVMNIRDEDITPQHRRLSLSFKRASCICLHWTVLILVGDEVFLASFIFNFFYSQAHQTRVVKRVGQQRRSDILLRLFFWRWLEVLCKLFSWEITLESCTHVESCDAFPLRENYIRSFTSEGRPCEEKWWGLLRFKRSTMSPTTWLAHP